MKVSDWITMAGVMLGIVAAAAGWAMKTDAQLGRIEEKVDACRYSAERQERRLDEQDRDLKTLGQRIARQEAFNGK